jgi:hypothetical protein
MIGKVLKTPQAKIVLSILWGLGLACMFRVACKGRDCIVFKAPDPDLIRGKIYKFDNSCYEYDTTQTKCSKEAIDIA